MKKIIFALLGSVMLSSHLLVQAQQEPDLDQVAEPIQEEKVDIANETPEPPTPEPEVEDEDDGTYKVRILKFGETDEENLEKFGIHTNYFSGNLTDEIFNTNSHPSFVYTVHSSHLTR